MSGLHAHAAAPQEAADRRGWLARHEQRVAYALVALLIGVAVGSATLAGVLLRNARDVERQSLRLQQLAGGAFRLQTLSLEAAAGSGIAASRRRAVAALTADLRAVRAHDAAAGDRIAGSYEAFVRASSAAFAHAPAAPPASEQHRLAVLLGRFEARVAAETAREAQATRVANPKARLALVVAAVAAALLVAVLIWQFELQRRAGRIDRDNAARSRELVRLREELVAGVSHELRTPLTSILGYLDLLLEEPDVLTPDQRGFLEVVHRNAHRLLQLVSDLLLVAEAKDGKPVLDLREVDLAALARECLEAARVAADDAEIELVLAVDPEVPLEGDRMRLAQMLDNLVSNALKFTPPGGRVAVTAALRHGSAVLQVEDTGVGIAPADQAQVFERFFRTRSATDGAVTGAGLGLAITKAIVDAHGGSIAVESAPGAGTTFRVTLPLRQAGSA